MKALSFCLGAPICHPELSRYDGVPICHPERSRMGLIARVELPRPVTANPFACHFEYIKKYLQYIAYFGILCYNQYIRLFHKMTNREKRGTPFACLRSSQANKIFIRFKNRRSGMKRKSFFTKLTLTLASICTLALAFIGIGALKTNSTTAHAVTGTHDHTDWTELSVVPSGAMEGGTYYLNGNFTCATTNDCTLGSGGSSCKCTDHYTVIPNGTTVEICLNGYTLDLGHCGIEVKAGGTLKIHDCSSAGTGKLTSINQYIEIVNQATIHVAGNLEINGGTVEYSYYQSYGYYSGGHAIRAEGASSNRAVITVNGGTFRGVYGIATWGYTDITINGGTVEGALNPDGDNYSYGIYAGDYSKPVNVKMTDGKISGSCGILSNSSNNTFEISGGAVIGEKEYAIDLYNAPLYLSNAPTIKTESTSSAAILLGNAPKFYATATADSTSTAYTGEKLTLSVSSSMTDGTTVVHNSEDTSNFELVSDEKILKAQDGNLVLAEKPHTHLVCGSATCAGHPDNVTHSENIVYDKVLTLDDDGIPYIDGVAITGGGNYGNKYYIPSGNYYLSTTVVPSARKYIEIDEGATVNLCLGGNTLYVYSMNVYGTLNLCACEGGKIIGWDFGVCAYGGTINVYNGEYTLNGGNYPLASRTHGVSGKTSNVTVYGGSFLSERGICVSVDGSALTIYDGNFTGDWQGTLRISAVETGTDVKIYGGIFKGSEQTIYIEDNHYSSWNDHANAVKIYGGAFETTGTNYNVLSLNTYGSYTPFCGITAESILGEGLYWLDTVGLEVDPTAVKVARVGSDTHVHEFAANGECACGATNYGGAIDNLNTAVDGLNGAVGNLNTAIVEKASTDDLQKAVDELTTAYKQADETLQLALQGKIDANTTEIEKLQEALNTAKGELQTAIDRVAADLEGAKNNLQAQITANDADITALNEAITDLDEAYKVADTLINSEIVKLQEEDATIKQSVADLQTELNKAKGELQTAIDRVAADLEGAKNNLQAQITANDTDITALNKAISDLDGAYKVADTLLSGRIDDLVVDDLAIKASVTALDEMVVEVKTELKNSIDRVAENLENAKSQLNTAIVNGDTALDEKIASLDKAYKAADALLNGEVAKLVAEDTAIKESIDGLKNSLTTVKGALEEAIAQVQKNLDDAKAELVQKDNQLKEELERQNEELNEKIKTLLIILCIVGALSVGCTAALVIVFIKKRKI